jgi:hypothetical protein
VESSATFPVLLLPFLNFPEGIGGGGRSSRSASRRDRRGDLDLDREDGLRVVFNNSLYFERAT